MQCIQKFPTTVKRLGKYEGFYTLDKIMNTLNIMWQDKLYTRNIADEYISLP